MQARTVAASGLSLDCSRRPALRTPDAPVIALPARPLPCWTSSLTPVSLPAAMCRPLTALAMPSERNGALRTS